MRYASHPQDAVYQNHANSQAGQAQSDDATPFAVGAFVLGYQPQKCARQSATAADTNPFLSSKPLVDTCALRRCISK